MAESKVGANQDILPHLDGPERLAPAFPLWRNLRIQLTLFRPAQAGTRVFATAEAQ